MAFTALLNEAMKLTPNQRADFAERLLESIDETGDDRDINAMTEGEFGEELERRHQEYLKDPSSGITLEEFKRRENLL